MKDGIYRLYRLIHDDAGGMPHRTLSSRFLMHKGMIHHLEDHDLYALESIPEGLVGHSAKLAMARWLNSPYFQLIHEDDLDHGNHLGVTDPLEVGPVAPDAVFTLKGPGVGPHRVEVQGDMVTVDGAQLSDTQADKLMQLVDDGTFVLEQEEDPNGGEVESGND